MPREKIFVKGNNEEERFDSIERVLQRFSRRLGRICAVYIPPFPVSSYVDAPDSDGVLFRYIFPLNGEVIKCIGFFASAPEKHLVEINFISKGASKAWEIEAERMSVFDVGLKVAPGDRITVTSYEPSLRGIWIGMAYKIDESETDVRKLVLDVIDKEAE